MRISELVQNAQGDLENIRDEEQETYEAYEQNGMEYSNNGEISCAALEALEEAVSNLEEAVSNLEEAGA
tara:strand:- start:1366 stop:1572 length:207 start_codon:yes stop_codon:yes gene_type:complete